MEGTDIIALSGALLGGQGIAPAVDALKDAGLPSRFAKLTAIVLGAAFGALAGAITADTSTIGVLAVAGLMTGLVASRNYDAAKGEGETKAENRILDDPERVGLIDPATLQAPVVGPPLEPRAGGPTA